jgi:hypothetical protein
LAQGLILIAGKNGRVNVKQAINLNVGRYRPAGVNSQHGAIRSGGATARSVVAYFLVLIAAIVMTLLMSVWAHAQTTVQVHETAIGVGAMQGSSGRLAVNIASGQDNLQSNQTAMAIGPNASASTSAQTHFGNTSLTLDPNAYYSAKIESKALSSSSGLISINQVSGGGNSQANLTTIVVGDPIGAASDGQPPLTAPKAQSGQAAHTTKTQPAVGLASDALAGSRGVVQLNQIAGAGNASVTGMTLRVAPIFNVR